MEKPCRFARSAVRCYKTFPNQLRTKISRPSSTSIMSLPADVIGAQKLEIELEGAAPVSALLTAPSRARACFVFAHGAGAGMTHPFMETVASGLVERGV